MDPHQIKRLVEDRQLRLRQEARKHTRKRSERAATVSTRNGKLHRLRRHRFADLLLVAALFCSLNAALPPPAAAATETVTVKGTFRYADIGTETTDRPIAFAKVEIWRFRPRGFFGIWSWGKDRMTTTDAQGSIAEQMDFGSNGVVYAIKVFASNRAAVVWPNDALHTVPFHREPGEPDGKPFNLKASSPGDVLDFSYDFRDRWSAQHYNLAETVRHGFEYANALRHPSEDDAIPPANVQPTSVTGSWYNPAVDTIVINSSGVFADFLILHEYAHFLEEQISSFAWIPSHHDGCFARDGAGRVINSPSHAWMEGFADYFAQSVGNFVPSGTLTGTSGTPTRHKLETPNDCSSLPPDIKGDAVENSVAGSLWDIADAPNDENSLSEDHDGLQRAERAIFQIFDHELDVYGTWPTVSAFRAAWMARGLPGAALSRILTRHRIPLIGDHPPVASAGADISRGELSPVELDGTGSEDPELKSLSFSWAQTSGPSVVLRNASAAKANFIAPAVGISGERLVFRLTVSDGSSPSSTDEVVVNVVDTGSVSSFPGGTVIQKGTLKVGSAMALRSDDNRYLQVGSTTSGMRTTSFIGRIQAVPNEISNLRVIYKGKNSRTCRQIIDIWRDADDRWIALDDHRVGARERLITAHAPDDAPSDYVSGLQGTGQVRIRVRCTQKSAGFVTNGDLMKIVYDRP